MNKKERDRINEGKYRKARIDRHNTTVNKFLNEAIENKKSVTRAIHELLDHEAQLEAQLRQSEEDKLNEVIKICSVLFKTMLPGYRASQLELWLAAFKRRFMTIHDDDYNIKDEKDHLQRAIELIENMERENAYIFLQNAIPIKGKG